MMPLEKKSTMIMMTMEKTTLRKPERRMFSPRILLEDSSRKRSHHSLQAINRKDAMQEPVTEPMPPMTTMSRIS